MITKSQELASSKKDIVHRDKADTIMPCIKADFAYKPLSNRSQPFDGITGISEAEETLMQL